jgi:hypothetical protein
MTRRVALRLVLLVIAAVALVVGLTAYFSSEKIPPCLVAGAPKWRPPTDRGRHRFLLVVPDRALCFYAIDDEHKLVGAVKLRGIRGIDDMRPYGNRLLVRYGGGNNTLVELGTGRFRPTLPALRPLIPPAPLVRPSDEVDVEDKAADVVYATLPGHFGFIVLGPGSRQLSVKFDGFAWNPKFGPNPPDHGLALLSDRRELWVLDAPNSVAHVYDVSGVPGAPPRHVDDVRFSKPLSGDENPCAHPRCGRLGSLRQSADGRYFYVGDSGDVIDAAKREVLLNLEALHQSRLMLEVDWVDGKPVFPR